MQFTFLFFNSNKKKEQKSGSHTHAERSRLSKFIKKLEKEKQDANSHRRV